MRKIILLLSVFFVLSCSKKEEDIVIPQPYNYSTEEVDMITKVNQYRESVGLPTLQTLEYIGYLCGGHNDYMIQNNVVDHAYFYDRCSKIEGAYNMKHVGEVVAFNYSTNSSTLQAWLNNPPHYNIIVGDFTHIGVSIKEKPENNKKYYTLIMAKQ